MSIEENFEQKWKKEQEARNTKEVTEFNRIVDEINSLRPRFKAIIETHLPANKKQLLDVNGRGYLF